MPTTRARTAVPTSKMQSVPKARKVASKARKATSVEPKAPEALCIEPEAPDMPHA